MLHGAQEDVGRRVQVTWSCEEFVGCAPSWGGLLFSRPGCPWLPSIPADLQQLCPGSGWSRSHVIPAHPLPVSVGALSVVRALNREEVVQHNLTVVAADHGFPRRSATQLLSILVLDVNDEAPTFEKPEYEAHITENLPAGSPVLQVLATDRDLGEDAGFNQGPSGDTAHRTRCAPSCLVWSACLTVEGGTIS